VRPELTRREHTEIIRGIADAHGLDPLEVRRIVRAYLNRSGLAATSKRKGGRR